MVAESKKFKALIIDDAPMNREILKEILNGDMDIVEIDNGQEACDYLMNHYGELSIVVLDLIMPGMNGFEVLNFMKYKHMMDVLPVIMISADNDERNIEKAYDLGVIDFIFRPFSERIVLRRVLTTISLFKRQRALITELDRQYKGDDMRVDELTGLDYKQSFFNKVYTHLRGNPEDRFVMMAIDIDHFKLFNNYYGWEEGDDYLKSIARLLRRFIQSNGGIAGYLGGDDFALLCPNTPDKMQKYFKTAIKDKSIEKYEVGFSPKIGIYEIDDNAESVMSIYDHATLALEETKGDYTKAVAYYDKEMLREVRNEYELLVDVQRGLREDEFIFFLQPKVNMSNGKVVGSEALVRWKHKDNGLVAPGVFIPVLEKNGFISTVDVVVWDKVAAWIRSWLDAGKEPLPVSLNVSRADIYTIDITEHFKKLIKKYDLPPELIEIEITESAYVEEYERVSKEIEKLQDAGFRILMDDFGAGYSSLNSLKDMSIDILKIDMKFLNMDVLNMAKGVSILESIVNMARSLSIPTIMEGVENWEQVEFLTEMGCTYAQGFYFYRPMPVSDFEIVLSDETKLDRTGIRTSVIDPVHVREFMDENLFSDVVINNILGPVAFYEVIGENIKLLRMNEQYRRLTGRKHAPVPDEDESRFDASFAKNEDLESFRNLFKTAREKPLNGASTEIDFLTHDEKHEKHLLIKLFFLRQVKERQIYYASFEEI